MEGASGISKQLLIGAKEGWEDHAMRLFSLKGGGNTPQHKHPWSHINYITKGRGILWVEGKEHDLSPGSIAYLPENTEHQFRNASGTEEFSFICIVPKEGES